MAELAYSEGLAGTAGIWIKMHMFRMVAYRTAVYLTRTTSRSSR